MSKSEKAGDFQDKATRIDTGKAKQTEIENRSSDRRQLRPTKKSRENGAGERSGGEVPEQKDTSAGR